MFGLNAAQIQEAVVPPQEDKYDHGFTGEQVEDIRNKFKLLERKVDDGYVPTVEEFSTIVVPHVKIGRTTLFNLKVKEAAAKVKAPKAPKEPKASKELRVAKPKKLSKTAINAELSRLVNKKYALNQQWTDEEQQFYAEHMPKLP